MMNNPRWQSEIDRELERISQQADLSNAGKPLKLDHSSHIPDDQRMANKIMKDHDVLPAWIMLSKELDSTQTQIRKILRQRWEEYHLGLAGAQDATTRQHVENVWKSAQNKVEAQIREYNDKVLTYNLKVPPGINHRRQLSLSAELEKLR